MVEMYELGVWLGANGEEFSSSHAAKESIWENRKKIAVEISEILNKSQNPLSKAQELLLDLKKWVPNTPEKLAAYTVMLTFTIALLSTEPNKQIKYEEIINNYTNNFVQNIENKNPEAATYAYVAVNRLNLRELASNKSRIIQTLSAGQVLTIMKKHGDWYLVKLSSFNEKSNLQGFVFAKHLAKFK